MSRNRSHTGANPYKHLGLSLRLKKASPETSVLGLEAIFEPQAKNLGAKIFYKIKKKPLRKLGCRQAQKRR
jgi:hypothetical protein